MRIIDEAVMDRFRTAGKCEWCGQVRQRLEPHHIWQRGIGGGDRLDVPLNLISLCTVCHTDVHAGKITRSCLLAIVSRREGVLQDDIEREIWRLRSLIKGQKPRAGPWQSAVGEVAREGLAPDQPDMVPDPETGLQRRRRNPRRRPSSEDWVEF